MIKTGTGNWVKFFSLV